MNKINDKSVTVATVTDLKNQSIADSNQKARDVFDYAEKALETQECLKCNPKLTIPTLRGVETKVCGKCRTESETQKAVILDALARPRKAVKLHQCSGCNNYLAASKFSIYYGVCKQCLRNARGKSKLGQSNFIERTLNTVRRNLRRALTDV
jgi:hypothetical protein